MSAYMLNVTIEKLIDFNKKPKGDIRITMNQNIRDTYNSYTYTLSRCELRSWQLIVMNHTKFKLNLM